MSDHTGIEWADATWNPIIGCSKCSPGCAHCYAERMAHRLRHMGVAGYTSEIELGGWTGITAKLDDRLHQPSHWRKPRRVFVCSMGDLFHGSIPSRWIMEVFEAITLGNRRHTYLILTKRAGRMRDWFADNQERFWHYHAPDQPPRPYVSAPWPDPCLWLGVTVCDQLEADHLIPCLLATPAAVRWVSIEPMLGPIKLPQGLDWVVCGAETGPGKRPMDLDWARSLRDQCAAANVPFFFKKDSSGRRELDGVTHDAMPVREDGQ